MAERVKKAKKPDVEVHQGSILIKRYSNRKLYDTSRSCYVTLEEVAAMVRNGQDVVIIDNKTKEDLTTVTLTQIIFEEEKKKSVMSIGMLKDIIKSSGETISEFITKQKSAAEKRVETIFKKPNEEGEESLETSESSEESFSSQKIEKGNEQSAEPAENDSDLSENEQKEKQHFKEYLGQLRSYIDELQKGVDENIKEAVDKVNFKENVDREFIKLKEKMNYFESRFQLKFGSQKKEDEKTESSDFDQEESKKDLVE